LLLAFRPMTSQLFFSLVKNDDGARALLMSLADVFPWVQFLPKDDVRAFLVELVETLRAAASVGNLAALEPVVSAWQATAEIYSDPDILKAATVPLDGEDYGEARAGSTSRPRRTTAETGSGPSGGPNDR